MSDNDTPAGTTADTTADIPTNNPLVASDMKGRICK